jgi:hypothetical protein
MVAARRASHGTMVDRIVNERPPLDIVRLNDRRRPGRVDYQSPDLIHLLRGETHGGTVPDRLAADLAELETGVEEDSLTAARGVGTGMLICALIWTIAGLGLWLLL